MLDTRQAFETPEGVELELEPAGLLVRGAAYTIDLAIKLAVLVVVSIAASIFGVFGIGIILISFFLLDWFYPVWFEVLRNGQTPGKKSMGISVMHADGTHISFGPSFIRNLLRFLDFLPAFWGAGLVSMVCSKEFKRLGDFAAGTMVVYVEKFRNHEIDSKTAETFSQPLRLSEKQLMVEFSERSQELSKERSIELAEILSDVTQRKGQDAVDHLKAVAKGIISDETSKL